MREPVDNTYMPFLLQVEKRVRPSIAVVLGHACERMGALFDFPEVVVVKARNRRWLRDAKKKKAAGIFAYWRKREGHPPYIEIACHVSLSMQEICHTAFHEIRHFEQWKNSRLDEDGMNRDADADMRWFVPRMVSLGRWEE